MIYDSDICPLPTITDKTYRILRAYDNYKNGLLPLSGGYLEQPQYFIRAMDFIEMVIANVAKDNRA